MKYDILCWPVSADIFAERRQPQSDDRAAHVVFQLYQPPFTSATWAKATPGACSTTRSILAVDLGGRQLLVDGAHHEREGTGWLDTGLGALGHSGQQVGHEVDCRQRCQLAVLCDYTAAMAFFNGPWCQHRR